MLVHRVVMVHVELHQRDDLAEFRHEAAEHAGFVHLPEDALDIGRRGQDLEEPGIGLPVVAQIVADQLERATDQLDRVGVEVRVVPAGEHEPLDQVARVLLEHVRPGDVQAAALEDKIGLALDRHLAAFERRQHPPDHVERLGVVEFQRRAEDAGQVAHILGHEEVALHEALDPQHAGAVIIAEPRGEVGLYVEGQLLVGPPGEEVEVAADRPEEILGALEQPVFLGAQYALAHQFGAGFDPVEILADPEQRVQVPETPLAVLDVGLDHVAGIAHLPVPFVALGHLGGDELRAGLGHDLGFEPMHQLVEQFAVAGQVARFQRRRAHRHVGARHADAVVDGADGMADLLAEVP